MKHRAIRKLLLFLPALSLLAGPLRAQTVKDIAVSATASYTDHISLAEDSKDTDVMVKFVFDEGQNILTVSVLSYRGLFVFQEPARYKAVVRHNCLIPEQLPYLAEAEKGSRFSLSKPLVKALPRPKKKYVFRRWIEYEGLQRTPTDYKMVNDYISQDFDIVGKRNVVSVTLRDVYLLDLPGKPDSYVLSRGRDLNTKYQIRILRNPCLGLDEEVVAARQAYGEVKTAYEGLKKKYPGGTVASEELLKIFRETQSVLLTQFPSRQGESPCPDIQDATERYNQYVDSIATFSCTVKVPDVTGDGLGEPGKGLDTKLVYSQARQLDKAVSRYLVSTDPLEKSDLVTQCKAIVSDMSAMIARQTPRTEEEKNAVRVYTQAEEYFKKTCGQ
jgi:hypothetical protein